MGKGGLNRLLLTSSDLSPCGTSAQISASDKRATHIRTLLSSSTTLRIAVEKSFTHEAAPASVNADASVSITLPLSARIPARPPPPILLLIAMQRPKAMARILEYTAQLGIGAILVVAADKVEKSYWDSKLFRVDVEPKERNGLSVNSLDKQYATVDCTVETEKHVALPGRPRGLRNHPERDLLDCRQPTVRRVDHLPRVRRHLQEGITQAATDASLPSVFLHKHGILSAAASVNSEWGAAYQSRQNWAHLVLHPRARIGGQELASVTEKVENAGECGVVLAIGPEGGWMDNELDGLEGMGFSRVGLGERVLRSETAVVVALGLAHEGLRRREKGE